MRLKLKFCSLFYAVSMVMGIPTVKRKVKSYLSETLHSLIDKLSAEEKLDCVIIVFVGEVSVFLIGLRKCVCSCVSIVVGSVFLFVKICHKQLDMMEISVPCPHANTD